MGPKGGRVERRVMRHKRSVYRFHRWISVVVGIWAITQALSGAVMLSGDQINRWSSPQLWDAGDGDRGAAAAVAAASQAFPGASVRSVALPPAAHSVYRATVVVDPKSQAQRLVYIDPATAAVNGVRDPNGGFVEWTSRWHNSLLQTKPILGIKPGQVVGYLGIATIVVLLSGLYLWYWPRAQRWRSLRRVAKPSSKRYKRLGDVHRVVGMFAAPVLIFILLFGMNIVFRDQARDLWYRLTPGPDKGTAAITPPPTSTSPAGTPLDADALARAAHGAVRGQVESITFGAKGTAERPAGAATVRVSHGYDPTRGPEGRAGNVTVYLDQFDGHVLRVSKPDDKPVFAQIYENWSFALHTGTFGGILTRVLWLLVAVAPLLLLLTGLGTVLVRRGKRRRRIKRVREALPELTRAEARLTAAHGVPRDAKAGDVLAREGAPSDSFFVIVSGEVDFVQNEGSATGEQHLRTLGPGAHFGEIGLLEGVARTATARAKTTCELLVLSARGFEELLRTSAATRAGLREIAEARLGDDVVRSGGRPLV